MAVQTNLVSGSGSGTKTTQVYAGKEAEPTVTATPTAPPTTPSEIKKIYPETFFSLNPLSDLYSDYKNKDGRYDYAIGGKAIFPSSPFAIIEFQVSTNVWVPVTRRNSKIYDDGGYDPDGNFSGSDIKKIRFDNHFDSIEITDEGGLKSCSLTLVDRDMSNLENIVMRSIVVSKLNSDVITQADKSATDRTSYIQFVRSSFSPGEKNSHFRIRFGYSDYTTNEGVVSHENSFLASDENWVKRGEYSATYTPKVFMSTPWLYFQMRGCEFNVTEKGLIVNIDAFSYANNIVNNARLINNYAVLKGYPEEILKNLSYMIYQASNGKILLPVKLGSGKNVAEVYCKRDKDNKKFEVYDPAENKNPKDKNSIKEAWEKQVVCDVDGVINTKINRPATEEELKKDPNKKEIEEEEEIELWFGTVPELITKGGRLTSDIKITYKTLSSIFDDLVNVLPKTYCLKIPRSELDKSLANLFNDEGEVKDKSTISFTQSPTTSEAGKVSSSIVEEVGWGWRVCEIGKGDEIYHIIKLFKKNPRKMLKKQERKRVYQWRANSETIVKNFSVKSELDFAQLNMQILTEKFDEEGKRSLQVYKAAVGEELDSKGSIINVSEDFERAIGETPFTLISATRLGSNNGGGGGQSAAEQVINNLNNGVFKGSIELMGDPFYFFDDKIMPFVYGIDVEVYRYVDEYAKKDPVMEMSYLSGTYVVKKINHKIDSSGFSTTLEIERYPEGKSSSETEDSNN